MGVGLHFFYCGTSLFTVLLHFLLLYYTLNFFKKPLNFTAESVLNGKMSAFRPLFLRKNFYFTNLTPLTPPSVIHGWKATFLL